MYLSSLVSFTDITTTPKFRSLAQSSLLSSLQLYFSVQKVSQNQCFNTALLLFPRTRSYLLYLPSQQIATAPFQLLRPRTTESSLMLSLTQSSLSANPFGYVFRKWLGSVCILPLPLPSSWPSALSTLALLQKTFLVWICPPSAYSAYSSQSKFIKG